MSVEQTGKKDSLTTIDLLAARLRYVAEDYWSNSCGMTDADGEKWDDGWIHGMKEAADLIEAWSKGERL